MTHRCSICGDPATGGIRAGRRVYRTCDRCHESVRLAARAAGSVTRDYLKRKLFDFVPALKTLRDVLGKASSHG